MTEQSSGRIYIRDLHARCIVGIYPEERAHKQDVIINITLEANLDTACQTDAIEDTVNYKSIKKSVYTMVENSQFFLIERLAEEVATLCLADPKVRQTTVTVDKPGALRFARSVAVEITRGR
jgi:dihydroneopterin aldolase/D-erythro-7,8-dihydroneopterin triphosphate epimerase